jgi:NAD(P)-dependent dehydrogenase (short-subunit alcohol dehydrogenase family)
MRVAVVTGAGQGLGRELARRLAVDGYGVVVAELRAETGEEAAAELGEAGLFVATDVSDEDSCARMVAAALERFGRIDALVNNAAIFSAIEMKPFWELGVEEWDRLMAVNLRGVWLASRAVFGALRERGAGSIVNMASGVIWEGRANYAHYVASKGGVFALTRAMAREAGAFGVRVNAVTPGPIATEVPRATVTPEQREALLRAQALRRPGTPADVASVVAFLISDESGFITGQTLNVDGGLSHH